MHAIYELKEMLIQELEEYGEKGELTAGTLDIVDKLAHATKNLCKVIEYCDEDDYSNASYEMSGRRSMSNGMSNRNSYRGNSYARGRGAGAKRDSMGRYARANGYSNNDHMVTELEDIMQMATDEQTKSMIRNLIQKMENM